VHYQLTNFPAIPTIRWTESHTRLVLVLSIDHDQTLAISSSDIAFTATKLVLCGLGVSGSCEGVLLPDGHDSRPVSVCCPASIVRPGFLERRSSG
jgi:hypothetical protein